MAKPAIFKLKKNWRGQWRWQLRSAHNGKIIGASSEGFKNRGDCIDNALLNLTGLENAELEAL